MNIKRIAGAIAALTVVAALSGCGKNVDVSVTGATKVPGTYNLYRFCDGPTLIYFSKYEVDPDEYEFVIFDGCRNGAPSAGQPNVQQLPDGN